MSRPVVELSGVGKVYGTAEAALRVLRSVDLAIGAGEFVGIVGASGSGKTTLMNIMGCLDRPTDGRYVLDGEVPLYYGRSPRARRRARAEELLASVGLSQRLGHQPAQLSGGESQRVAVARALANEPALILADEPTGNLDTQSGEDVMQLFFELHRAGRTVVIVTHNPEIAARLPRVVEMRDGAIVGDTRRSPLAGAEGA